MRLTLDSGAGTYRISEYGEGYVTINEERLTASVVVMPERLIRGWGPEAVPDLETTHLQVVADLNPEVVLIGTGRFQTFPRSELLSPLLSNGVGFEIMDTTAACRTYNILMAEGRTVAAALLMIGDSTR